MCSRSRSSAPIRAADDLPARLARAARNNAVWCDTVCRSHGGPGVWTETLWLHRGPVPRFYPNAVTLTKPDASVQIEQLRDAELPSGAGVKDSFHALDLTPLGFRVLFTAEWIGMAPEFLSSPREEDVPVGRWTTIRSEAELADWEAAWNGGPVAPAARLFLPPLLADEAVRVLAAYRDNRIVAGGIANRTGDVVGLSNVFAPASDAGLSFRAGCVAAVQDAFPGLPIVGYESGADLDAALALGFASLGSLRVWVKEG